MTTYESALRRIADLAPSAGENERLVDWIDDKGHVGVARTRGGRVELFLAGPELSVSFRSIADQIVHRQYFRKDGGPFTASRLELPLAGHFDQVAAFICAELIRNGSSTDIKAAFFASEAVIDMALEGLQKSDSWLRGLVTELAFLDSLVGQAKESAIFTVLESWSGYQPSLRDFSLGHLGIEVKSTSRGSSTHAIQGLHQIESQEEENQLFLVSFVGLTWKSKEDPESLTARTLVDRIATRVIKCGHPNDILDRLRFQVSEYLPKNAGGTDPLDRPFQWTAVRTYDLSDAGLQFVGSDDVARRPNTVLASVRYDVELPDHVSGDINPVVGLNKSAAMILAKAGLSN